MHSGLAIDHATIVMNKWNGLIERVQKFSFSFDALFVSADQFKIKVFSKSIDWLIDFDSIEMDAFPIEASAILEGLTY